MKITPSPRSAAARVYFNTTPDCFTPESRRRFVENEHSGAEVDGAGDGHRLPLATGHRADRLVDVADVDAHLGHLFLGRLLHEGAAHDHTEVHRFDTEEEVAPHRQQRREGQILEHRGDAGVAGVARGGEVHR